MARQRLSKGEKPAMRTKPLILPIAICLGIAGAAGPAQAQIFSGRHCDPAYAPPEKPAVYGKYGPGIYDNFGVRFYGLPDFPAAMDLYGFPNPVFPPYSPYGSGYIYSGDTASRHAHFKGAALGSTEGTDAAKTVASRSFYSGPSVASDKAEFCVKVPVAEAKVYFNDTLIEQQGTERRLQTPALQAATYSYRIRATWTENGQAKSQEQFFRVQPGQVLNLEFPSPTDGGKQ
jgi:uncharacterized protein (TIGR03000 family)